MVTVRSVLLGSISDATTTEADVTSRISLIFDPPLPIRDPHWEAGTIRRRVTDPALPEDEPESDLCDPDPSSSSFLQIRPKDLKIASVGPVTVTMRSGIAPSEMWILAPDSSLILFIISPPFPIMDPTSLPVIKRRIVRVTVGASTG